MTLDQNIRLFRKWWWLILLAGLIAGGAGYLLRNRQAPSYQATAILAFGNVINNPNADNSNFTIGENLSQTYAELGKTNTILSGTINTLHLPVAPGSLLSAIDYKVITTAGLLQIVVTYNNAVLSAAIANEVVDQLLANAPANLTANQQQQVQQISDQIGQIYSEITTEQQHLSDINDALRSATAELEINNLSAQREVAISQISALQATLAQLENTLSQLQNRQAPVQVYERAQVPSGPLPNNALQSGLLAAVVAASLTVAVVLLVTYFDNSNVHTADELSKAVGLSILGTISRYGNNRDSYRDKLVTHQPLRIEVLETYRLCFIRLTTALQRLLSPVLELPASVDTPITDKPLPASDVTFLVSSPAPGDGKSVVSANLAVTAALFGLRVLLIDADLYQPTLHKFFGLKNEVGLSNLMSKAPFMAGFAPNHPFSKPPNLDHLHTATDFIQETDLANLTVLTSGPVTEAIAKSLSLVFQEQWLEVLRDCVQADLVIIDTPPCLAVADGSVLAAKTGARVVLVVSAGRTSVRTVLKAKEQFARVNARLEGVILNMVEGADVEFDYKSYGQAVPDKGKLAKLQKAKATK